MTTSTSTAAPDEDGKKEDAITVTFQLLSGADVELRFPRGCTNSRAIEIISESQLSSSNGTDDLVLVDASSGRRLPHLGDLPPTALCDALVGAGDGAVVLALPAPRPPPERERPREARRGADVGGDDDPDSDVDDVFRYRPPSSPALRSFVEAIRSRGLLPDPLLSVALEIPRKVWISLLLWPLGAKVASLCGVGPLFILLSIVAAIAANLGERKPGEASAYTIFNEGFRPLLGQLRAEQLDEGLRRGNL